MGVERGTSLILPGREGELSQEEGVDSHSFISEVLWQQFVWGGRGGGGRGEIGADALPALDVSLCLCL